MVDRGAAPSPFGESSYFFGTNIPGKPRKYLLNSGGRPKLFTEIADESRANDYEAFTAVAVETVRLSGATVSRPRRAGAAAAR